MLLKWKRHICFIQNYFQFHFCLGSIVKIYSVFSIKTSAVLSDTMDTIIPFTTLLWPVRLPPKSFKWYCNDLKTRQRKVLRRVVKLSGFLFCIHDLNEFFQLHFIFIPFTSSSSIACLTWKSVFFIHIASLHFHSGRFINYICSPCLEMFVKLTNDKICTFAVSRYVCLWQWCFFGDQQVFAPLVFSLNLKVLSARFNLH